MIKKPDPVLAEKIMNAWDGKRSYREIATIVGCQYNTVWKYAQTLGLKKPGMNLSPETKAQIEWLSDGRRSYREIAEIVGVSKDAVERFVKSSDLNHRKPGGLAGEANPNSNWTDEERRIVLELYKTNLSISQIAEHVGRTHASVEKFLHRRGLNKRKAGPPSGRRNPAWRNRQEKVWYKKILSPKDHPYYKGKLAPEHRLIMEQKLGRYLKPNEVVHHIDENPLNNDPDNLEVFASQAEHLRFHFAEEHQTERLKRLNQLKD